jgi:hypothetical protein
MGIDQLGVISEYVTGYDIVDDEGELLCLVLAACG